ncbi:MAG: hypothetical protein KC432_03675 [Thermomicrobiales bacterium]|nr:hypothetical protein [Thermomicrobiales bacterium]
MVSRVAHRRDAVIAVLAQVIEDAERDREAYQSQRRAEHARDDAEAEAYCDGMEAGLTFLIDTLRSVLRLI